MRRNRKIKAVPLTAITVVSPRDRRKSSFKEIVASIKTVGLKRPITVSTHKGFGKYELVCGEGRMRAFSELNASESPAILVDATTEECILMSLVENIARRRHAPVELVNDVKRLSKEYSANEIAAKLGVSRSYVKIICYLLEHGEEHVISSLERHAITPTLALQIARANTPELQAALLKVCEQESRSAHEVAKLRQLFERRRRTLEKSDSKNDQVTPADLVRVHRLEMDRQKVVARKADLTHMRLLFIVNALKALLKERMFVTLLREEGLERMPLPLLRRLSALPVT
jgi:ParB family transcriptional regulator, chromosome partitioning protein